MAGYIHTVHTRNGGSWLLSPVSLGVSRVFSSLSRQARTGSWSAQLFSGGMAKRLRSNGGLIAIRVRQENARHDGAEERKMDER